jgi:hypothetical protein
VVGKAAAELAAVHGVLIEDAAGTAHHLIVGYSMKADPLHLLEVGSTTRHRERMGPMILQASWSSFLRF